MKTIVYKKLPDEIKSVLYSTDGWLVGSSIEQLIKGSSIKDYDILVEDSEKCMRAIKTLELKHSYKLNSYGGMKFSCDGYEIDMWIQDLSSFIKNANSIKYVYNFSKNILIEIKS